jgi:hypothetical protein
MVEWYTLSCLATETPFDMGQRIIFCRPPAPGDAPRLITTAREVLDTSSIRDGRAKDLQGTQDGMGFRITISIRLETKAPAPLLP